MNILVTGAAGFLGRHVTSILKFDSKANATTLTRQSTRAELEQAVASADAVIHLAGVNRPANVDDFVTGNVDFTRHIVDRMEAAGRRAKLVLASSSRAGESTPYGESKARAEEIAIDYGNSTGAAVAIFRLPNVFGKWSRPNYNSAVATFCHSIARGLPFQVHDSSTELSLVYAEDAARQMIASALSAEGIDRPSVDGVYKKTLGEIVTLLSRFRDLRRDLFLPDFSDPFVRKLYTTYVSFLPDADLAYSLQQHTDVRGSLAELLKSPFFGQIFLSRTKPGVTRGNHFHQTKTEKFIVVDGLAEIRVRDIDNQEVTRIEVGGTEFRVVDIPPGSTHSITNIGKTDLVTLFWSSEIFDSDRPDTFMLPVEDAQ